MFQSPQQPQTLTQTKNKMQEFPVFPKDVGTIIYDYVRAPHEMERQLYELLLWYVYVLRREDQPNEEWYDRLNRLCAQRFGPALTFQAMITNRKYQLNEWYDIYCEPDIFRFLVDQERNIQDRKRNEGYPRRMNVESYHRPQFPFIERQCPCSECTYVLDQHDQKVMFKSQWQPIVYTCQAVLESVVSPVEMLVASRNPNITVIDRRHYLLRRALAREPNLSLHLCSEEWTFLKQRKWASHDEKQTKKQMELRLLSDVWPHMRDPQPLIELFHQYMKQGLYFRVPPEQLTAEILSLYPNAALQFLKKDRLPDHLVTGEMLERAPLRYIPQRFRTPDLIEMHVARDPDSLSCVRVSDQTLEMIRTAVEMNPRVWAFASSRDLHPTLRPLLAKQVREKEVTSLLRVSKGIVTSEFLRRFSAECASISIEMIPPRFQYDVAVLRVLQPRFPKPISCLVQDYSLPYKSTTPQTIPTQTTNTTNFSHFRLDPTQKCILM